MIRPRNLILAALAAFWFIPAAHAQVPSEAKPLDLSAEEIKQKKQLVQAPDEFSLELYATPPEVNYPAVITATPSGNLFVGVDGNGSLGQDPGRGEILKVLDTNNDGQADHYTVFVDSVESPRGLVYDGETLYVMHPPTLTAFTDTNGDGVADERKDLVQGLGFGLDFRGADHTTNGMQMGIDGWLYISVGDYGFLNATGTDGRQITHRGGGIVRVRPDGTELEVYASGLRNSYDVALTPKLDGFVRDNTNDGYGWNTRLEHILPQAQYGYPSRFLHFADEVMAPLADYGGGSGTGALYVDTPALPDSLGHTLYTVDWGRSAVFRHALSEQGATFQPSQEVFVRMPQPTDMTIDGRSNLYLASWMGASFTYAGEDVGFIVRLTHESTNAGAVPDFANASTERLVDLLSYEHSLLRRYAQRELLRREPAPDVVREIAALGQSDQPVDVRIAALFTLKQLRGSDSHPLLADLAGDNELREFALRALADRPSETENVSTTPFLEALSSDDPRVRLQATNGLTRLGASDAADDVVPLLTDPDPAVSHVAVQALVELGAVESALEAVRHGSPALVRGAMKVLVRLHRPETVTGLQDILQNTPDPFVQRQAIGGLARLYHKEATEWTQDDWWGTTPSTRGPYYNAVEWAESDRIRPTLRSALLDSDGYEYRRRVHLVERNRAVPDRGSGVLLAAASDSLRARTVDILLGNPVVTRGMVSSLDSLSRHSLAMQRATTDLLTAQDQLPAESVSLLGDAAHEAALQASIRAAALRALSNLPVEESLVEVTTTYARMFEGMPTHPAPLTEAIREYVGLDRHSGHVDHFATMAASGTSAERTLSFCVLLNLAENEELDADVQSTIRQTVNDGWDDPMKTTALLRAIGYTQVEGYNDQVRRNLRKGNTANVRAAAQYAADRLGL